MKRPRGPAARVMRRAATTTLGYTFAWTLRMHTAAGTLTTLLPRAPMPPATNAMVLTEYSLWRSRRRFAAP